MKNKILSHLPGDFPWQVHWFNTVDSTNDRAKAMAQAGAPHGTAVLAGEQTGGRGRMGRCFSSPAGMGLYLSVILRPGCPAHALMHLTCGVGTVVCDAVENTTGFRPALKWINDLVANKKKLGGILTELSTDPATGLVDYAVVGIGINICQDTADFPQDIRNIATSVKAVTGTAPDYGLLAAEILRALEGTDLLTEKSRLMAAYRRDCITLGKPVVILQSDGRQEGLALDVDPDGGLLVALSDGSITTVQSGEVSVRGLYGYI